MDLTLYLKIARRWWWLVLLPALAAGAYAAVTYRTPAPVYTAVLRFTVGQPEPANSGEGYDPNYYRWLASEYIAAGLKDWVRTGAFAAAVSRELAAAGQDVPAAAVAGALASDNARSVLVVYLTWGDPAQFPALAAAVTAALQKDNAAVFPQLGGQAAVITPLDQAAPGPVAPALRARLDLPLKAAIGLAFGVFLALAAHFLDPRVRDGDDLEAAGLTLRGEIPRPKSKV